MRKCLILFFAFAVTSVSGAPAWTWVDANGQVHYSDTPVPGAKQIELSAAQMPGGSQRRPQTVEATPRATEQGKPGGTAASHYYTFYIVSPKQQETLSNIGTVVDVQVAIAPPLEPNHRIDLIVDGERRNLNATSTGLTLNNVFRGVHVIYAVIVDQSGTEVLRSDPTTITVQQTSIQNPQNPQRPQPQPKRP